MHARHLNFLAIALIVVAVAPDALAISTQMDPDGAPLWQQIGDWFATVFFGTEGDPNGGA